MLTAVDSLDTLRGLLNDREDFQPLEIRGELLKLHGPAMKVIGAGARGGTDEMFDLAEDLEEQVAQMDEARPREPFEISNGGQGLDYQRSTLSGRTAN